MALAPPSPSSAHNLGGCGPAVVTGEKGATIVDLRIEKRVHVDGSVYLTHLVRHPDGWAHLGMLRCTHNEAADYLAWLRFSRPDGHQLEVERVN